ncbi:MAG: hypothetical protein H5U24_09285 [Thioclava marina]|uniref:hypothetical protein n=1 Tax=Thioclava marina TaxID=1915077 RepID=UPI0019B7EC73|nr:hypothetical protein [Thioclava marina]MBC7145583.1 hypothetical protein [Thioclava marina]
MNELEAQQVKLNEEISRLSAGEQAPPLVESAPRALEQVLCGLEKMLGDPNWVHLANEHLTALIARVTLLPDPDSEGHMTAEIIIDLGDLLSAAGQPQALAYAFRDKRQITVKLGALPPRRLGASPPRYFYQEEANSPGSSPRRAAGRALLLERSSASPPVPHSHPCPILVKRI